MRHAPLASSVGRGTRLAAVGGLLVGAVLAATGGNATAQSGPDWHRPHIGHVWTIILENKSYEATFSGLNQNDYLWKTLPSYGELLAQYYGTGHFSLDNYLSLVSGQAPAPDNQADCPAYKDVAPGTRADDGQVHATSGCVYPAYTRTLFNQLDDQDIPWKIYAQDLGRTPGREDAHRCGIPGDPSGAGVPDIAGADAGDQYVPKHNPAAWFHSLIDNPEDCANVVPLDGTPASSGHPARTSGLAEDLKSEETTPAFSWITPDNCSDAHDTVCKGDNLSGDPNNHQGGLYAADLFLQRVIPQIMSSPAFQHNGLIQIVFDEAFPPYKMYGNSLADYTGNKKTELNTPSDTAQSVVACCNELPGPNTSQPGFQAFGQDTTPGGGITGAVFISRFIKPGSVSNQPYNHYSWLRSMEDLFGTTGGLDGEGHLAYAAMPGLRPFGGDVYNNPSGRALQPAPSGSITYPAVADPWFTGDPTTPPGSPYSPEHDDEDNPVGVPAPAARDGS